MTQNRPDSRRLWLAAALFSAAYYACAWSGRVLSAPEHAYVSFWLPAGLYVGVLLLYPMRSWPRFVLAAVAANILFDVPLGTPWLTILGFCTANTLQAVTGAWLMQRFVADKPQLATLREFFGLVSGSVVLSAMLGSAIAAGTLVAAGMSQPFFAIWKTLWGSNAMAILLVTPLMMVWFAKSGPRKPLSSSPAKLAEAVLLTMALTGFTWYMLVVDRGINAPYKSRLMPLLLWAGLRFGLRGATAANLLLAVMMSFCTTHYLKGLTPVEIASGTYVGMLQSFLVISVLITLVPAIVIEERNRKVLALSESEEKFSKAFQSNPSGIAITDQATGRYIEVNDSFCRLYGYTQQEVVGRTSLELGVWKDVEDRERLLQPLRDGGSVQDLELNNYARNGQPRILLVNAERIELGGKPCIVSLIKDITERKQADRALRESEKLIREQYLELESFY
ncbi:MAG TPA: MASE1 domain-containing protein, partial [Candidatus Acidoferrales bacterium]|nr:MASE1 domain-containing protein [Candidatus Acidoferrales bacterium]